MNKQGEHNMDYLKRIVFSCLIAIMSFYCMMTEDYQHHYAMLATVVVGFAMGWILYERVSKYLLPYYRNHIGLALFGFLWACGTAVHLMFHNIARAQEKSVVPVQVFRWYGYGLAALGIWICLLIAIRYVKELIEDVWSKLSQTMRREYVVVSALISIVMVVCYCLRPGWYTFFDRIYSVDSSSLIMNLYGNPEFLEVAHPLYGIVSYPISTLVLGIDMLIVPKAFDSIFFAIGIQLICIQTVLWTGLFLHLLTKHPYIFRVYCCSNAVLFYCLALEKYQIATFLVVLYLYLRTEKLTGSDTALALAGGTMFTSYYAGIVELLAKEPFKEKMKNVGRIILWTLGVTIASGHFRLLDSEIFNMFTLKNGFALDVPIMGRLQAVLWMIHSGFIPLESTENGGFVIWRDVNSGWSIIGIMILAIAVFGFVCVRRSKVHQAAMAWCVLSILLFVPLNWCATETPLFHIYFHWAYLLLFMAGMDRLVKWLRFNPKVFYNAASMLMLVVCMMDYLRILQVM